MFYCLGSLEPYSQTVEYAFISLHPNRMDRTSPIQVVKEEIPDGLPACTWKLCTSIHEDNPVLSTIVKELVLLHSL